MNTPSSSSMCRTNTVAFLLFLLLQTVPRIALAADERLGPGGGELAGDAGDNTCTEQPTRTCYDHEDGSLDNARLTLNPVVVCPGQLVSAHLECDVRPGVAIYKKQWFRCNPRVVYERVSVPLSYTCDIDPPPGSVLVTDAGCDITFYAPTNCGEYEVKGTVMAVPGECGVTAASQSVSSNLDVVTSTISLECTTPATKVYPGAFVGVNDNDSNGNGIPDLTEPHVVGEADLLELTLQACDPRNPPTCPVTLTLSAPQYIRIDSTPTKDGPELTGGGTVSVLNFNLPAPGYSTNLWIEGYRACQSVREEVLTLSYLGCEDIAKLTVVSNNIEIARYQGSTVPQDMEASNGSVVKLVPKVNAEGVYLSIPKLEVFPPDAAPEGILWLKKPEPSCSSQGKVRIYKNGVLFMDEDEGAKRVFDTIGPWTADSTHGGVVDVALIAYCASNSMREIYRDTIRISSIPCHPNPGDTRIIFVNPDATAHDPPYNDYKTNAASTIEVALSIAAAQDNVLVSRDSFYSESGLKVPDSVVVGGLGGCWLVDDPSDVHPQATVFAFSDLPPVSGVNAGVSDSIFVFGNSVKLTGFRLMNNDVRGVPIAGGAVRADNKSDSHLCYSEIKLTEALSGGGVSLSNSPGQHIVEVCNFHNNLAEEFGGAIRTESSGSTTALIVKESLFSNNKTVYKTWNANDFTKGMGGAIASVGSVLTVNYCNFDGNSAEAVSVLGGAPPDGSAGGGGDLYVKTGTLHLLNSKSRQARAGFPRAQINPPDDETYFTGDGGSVLVHGSQTDTSVEISDCTFEESISYGNGGAISLSKDCSPKGRCFVVAYFLPGTRVPYYVPFYPEQLGGGCVARINRVSFKGCKGGWQGGAISINGRYMDVVIDGSQFKNCQGGATHLRDGKGGAVAVGGGIQTDSPPQNSVVVKNCTVDQCSATGNAGGLYVTIRGKLNVLDSVLLKCLALNSAGSAWRMVEGMGGGIHASAGGNAYVTSGDEAATSIGPRNIAAVSGGGVSIKSAKCFVDGNVGVCSNIASGAAADGYGNGGGVFVTTSFYDETLVGAGYGAATLYNEHGFFWAMSGLMATVTVANNECNRWGGGLYAGLSDPWVSGVFGADNEDPAFVSTYYATVRDNRASHLGERTLLYPSQIAAETVRGTGALLDFQGDTVSGNASWDIGIYTLRSVAPITNGVVFSSLAEPTMEE